MLEVNDYRLQELYHNGNPNNYPQITYEYIFEGQLIHTEIEYANTRGKEKGAMYQIFKTTNDKYVLYREFFSCLEGELTFSVINTFNHWYELAERIPVYLRVLVEEKLLKLKNQELNESYIDENGTYQEEISTLPTDMPSTTPEEFTSWMQEEIDKTITHEDD
jgi:hypothetical protein